MRPGGRTARPEFYILREEIDRLWTYATTAGVMNFLAGWIKAIPRRARGMRDEQLLLLKLRWTTANPVRTASDLGRFLHQDVHSNR